MEPTRRILIIEDDADIAQLVAINVRGLGLETEVVADGAAGLERALGGGEESVRLSVADTGRGIAAEELAAIFDRFYRGERSRGRSAEEEGAGSGLGLAIVKRIAELHHTEVAVESTLGAGSTFSLRLARGR